MANPEHLKILKQGVEQWNKWREEHGSLIPDLRKSDLHGATLVGADLRLTDLHGAVLVKADLRNADLTAALVGFAHLDHANLNGAQLSGVDFSGTDLSGADLSGTKLLNAAITSAFLTEVNLGGADLQFADLSLAFLDGANLSGANLMGTNFGSATPDGANFAGARVHATRFADVDLSTAKGLETVIHKGPSTIGIDTIYKSRGKIPEAFLRGCGVPDSFIAYIGSMVGRSIEFYSCFISYSTKDQEFADRLYADLQNKGVRCWFAPHDIQGGRKLHEQLDEAIRLHDKLLLILSEHSMNSNWVKTEILRAQKREIEENKSPTLSSNHPNESNGGARWGPRQDDDKDGAPTRKKKQILFPITLVPYAALENWEYAISTGIDLAEEIRQYFIPDFSNWKDHDSYQKAFQRLVKDLKAE